MIFESVQFSKNQVGAYNAYLAAQRFAPICQFTIQSDRRHPLRCKGTTKIAHTQVKSKEKMPFMRIWHKWQMIYISKSV
jgi:hypothetical protein